MCYLKNITPQQHLNSQIWNHKQQESSEAPDLEPNVLIPCLEKSQGIFWTIEQQMLVKIFQIIEKNNVLISRINNLFIKSSQKLEKSNINSENSLNQDVDSINNFGESLDTSSKNLCQNSSICTRLFGAKKYKFHLITNVKFQDVIYKERNFNVGIKLMGSNGRLIKNCNLITLCFAVCTTEAEWIHENRIGEPLLKGKTQIELYKGQANFQKLYVREVSRVYPQGKVMIVIYPKPLLLKYSTQGPSQECVNIEDIQPLIIENISIRAKRKQ